MRADMRTGTGIEYYRELQAAKPQAPYGAECWNKECRFEQCANENRCLDWPIGFPPDHVEPSKMEFRSGHFLPIPVPEPNLEPLPPMPTQNLNTDFGICVCGHGRAQHENEIGGSCNFCACKSFLRRATIEDERPISIWDDRHPAWTQIAHEATTPIYDRIMAKSDAIRPTITIQPGQPGWLAQLRAENARKIRVMAGAPIRRKNA